MRLAIDADLQGAREDPVFDGDSPAVWIIDAGTLNRRSCGEDVVLYPGGPRTAAYLPEALDSSTSTENEMPLALCAPRTNVRLAAQQGTFTIHGHSSRSLEEIATDTASVGVPIHLACITFDRRPPSCIVELKIDPGEDKEYEWAGRQFCGFFSSARAPVRMPSSP